jgi:hypothetical protein
MDRLGYAGTMDVDWQIGICGVFTEKLTETNDRLRFVDTAIFHCHRVVFHWPENLAEQIGWCG